MILWRIVLVGSCLPLTVSAMAQSEQCHDWDGDDAPSGLECSVGTDCADDLWTIRPGSLEVCDGFDSDCDTNLDQGCDRYCDTPVLSQNQSTLSMSSEFPELLSGGDIALLPDGFLACGSNYFYDPNTDNQKERVVVRRFDRLGQPRGPSERVGRPIDATLDEAFCRLAVGGDRALVTWRQYFPGPDSTYKYFARQLDLFGRPLGTVVEVTGQFGGSSAYWGVPVWNGETFGVFWAQGNSPRMLWLTTVPRWPDQQEPTKVLVSDNLLGDARLFGRYDAKWSDGAYLLAFQGGKGTLNAMMSLRVDRNGVPLNSGYETPDHGEGGVALAPVGTRTLMVWIDVEIFSALVWYQFVDTATGQALPPGPRQLMTPTPFNGSAALHDPIITWTGEMFVVEVTNQYFAGANPDYDHWLWRIREDGTVLDPQGIRLSGPGPRAEATDMIWDGKELLYFFSMKFPRDLRRARVACSCGDLDHDGRNSCADDCDDSNAQVAVTRPEICTGGLDDDCDGLVDCRDPNCTGGPGPVEVANVRWSGNTLTWNVPATATRYAIARGLISDLVRRQDMIHADCPAYENVGTTWFDDGRKPPVGDVLWYQVRAEAGPCRYGSWGVEPLRASIEACN